MLLKCYTHYASKFGKLISGHRTGKVQFSFQSQRRAMPKNVQTTTQSHSFHMLLLLLLLSCFSCAQFCATPETAAHQAPPYLRFSRQQHWSGLPFPSPMQESETEVAQLCLTPSDPMDCSLTGSSVHGIFQARVLEWGAIAFSVSHASKVIFKFLQARTLRNPRCSHCV